MNPLFRRLGAFAALFAVALSAAATEATLPAKKRVLFFTKSSGFEHEAIKLKTRNGSPGFAFAVMQALGGANNIEFTFSKDGSLFTTDYLAGFDAIVFYTTGDLTLAKNAPDLGDGNPPMRAEGKAALLRAIESGKGFVGIHPAADTFHSSGDRIDSYVRMLGGEFVVHEREQAAHQIVVDSKFPGMGAVPADFAPQEEWYSLKNFPADLHVLLLQETKGMEGAAYRRPPYPSTWARMQGKGRVFYTSMGHRRDVWENPVFQAVLLGGLNWALGRVDADVTSNLATAAPRANELPDVSGSIAPK